MPNTKKKDGRSWELLSIYNQNKDTFRRLTYTETADLARNYRKTANNLLRNQIVEHNLGLSSWLAYVYRHTSIEHLDLIQEGNAGLIKAASLFNPDKGASFHTHAFYWIRHAIQSALCAQAEIARLPAHFRPILNKARQLIEDARNQNKPVPTAEEIASSLSVTLAMARRALLYANLSLVSFDEIMSSRDHRSNITYHDIFADQVRLSPEGQALALSLFEETRQEIQKVVNTLKETRVKDKIIFIRRYGIDRDLSLIEFAELAKIFAITRQEARQIIYGTWSFLHEENIDSDDERFAANLKKMGLIENIVSKTAKFIL